MQRDTLRTILDRISGLRRSGASYSCDEGVELSLYLGEPGRAMVVGHVQRLELLDTHMEISARDKGTLYTTLDAVHAVECLEPDGKRKGQKRAGVGFSP